MRTNRNASPVAPRDALEAEGYLFIVFGLEVTTT